MDAPRVALRFRDVTPGVDTIAQHQEILRREGAVWWGWWKKEFEPGYEEELAQLALEEEAHFYLVDRSTDRAYLACVIRVVVGLQAEVDQSRVPAYYWPEREQVAAWFLFRDIQEAEYPADVARSFGQATFLHLTEQLERPRAETRTETIPSPHESILHISDMHFGGDYAFLPPGVQRPLGSTLRTLTDSLATDLGRLNDDLRVAFVIASGDFTTEGDWTDHTRAEILEEIASLTAHLGLERSKVLASPGNHDIVRYGEDEGVDVAELIVDRQTTYSHERDYRTFAEELTGRSWRDPLNHFVVLELRDCDVVLCSLNSCTITSTRWTEYGYVGDAGLDLLARVGEMPVRRPTYRIMTLHHHLVPVTRVEAPNSKGVSLTLDAVEVLDAAQRAGVQLILHGHKHQASIATFNRLAIGGEPSGDPMTIVSGGSAGARASRLPGSERNTYSVLTFGTDTVSLILRELRPDGREGMELFRGILPVAPHVPE